MTRYVVYDVFTDTPFGGNQLAVFPDASTLPEAQLQSIAAEFNFSEVTFVYSPDDPSHTARVRIFTPTMEIPFAGHPTIGTAIALSDAGQTSPMVLELGVGPLTCRVSEGKAAFTTSTSFTAEAYPDPALVAAALSLPQDALRLDRHPPVLGGVGLAFVLVELDSRSLLRRAQPAVAAIREGAALYPAGLDFAIFAYVRDGAQVDARMFAPLDNIPEDPATGSACAALAALLSDSQARLSIRQGEDMGRPSRIETQATAESVTVFGSAVRMMEGRLVI
ncbi:MAG: PhzF family phenazine biosynthesis protein [Loktanella sp.]|nr:PhzF family phenazine biosynthesis protein [Loktanella sp.]